MRRRATRRPDAVPTHSPGPPVPAASPGGARSCGHRLVFGLYRAGHLAGAAPRMEARVDRARRSTRARCSCTPALPPRVAPGECGQPLIPARHRAGPVAARENRAYPGPDRAGLGLLGDDALAAG